MSGGMAFRKDCEDCRHSFFDPRPEGKVYAPRCAGKSRKMGQPEKIRPKDPPSKTTAAAKAPNRKRSLGPPAHHFLVRIKKVDTLPEIRSTPPKSKDLEEETREKEPGQTPADQGFSTEKMEIILTEERTQEIIEQYQAYVQVMERPARGRRKTIAAEMGLPYRTVVLTLRNWDQDQKRDLSREDRFSVEKAYFSFLKKQKSFAQIKERICRETGLDPWSVSRYLDILHDGEDKLKKVPEISLERRTAILDEYNNYLSDSAPPGPFLHPLIAEKIGITAKQVHKVLLAFRLDRFRGAVGLGMHHNKRVFMTAEILNLEVGNEDQSRFSGKGIRDH